jgi:hypothetical protein
MAKEVVKLSELSSERVPDELKPAAYFDFKAHPFAHEALFERDDVNSVYGAILAIGKYAKEWLAGAVARAKADRSDLVVHTDAAPGGGQAVGHFEVVLEPGATFEPACVVGSADAESRNTVYLAAGARVIGSVLYLDEGGLYVGSGTRIEPGVGIKGPTIIGKKCEIRQGAYLRGKCILGDGCTIRGELKNVVMMDKANFPHPSYVGDSICGYMTHFGNQVAAANLGIFEGLRDVDKRHNLVLTIDGVGYDLGTPKMGVCMGDFSQIGCNSVTDPGTFLRPYTITYPLTLLRKGFYGPEEIWKNKPIDRGVVERAPLRPLQ